MSDFQITAAMWKELLERVSDLERKDIRLGPSPKQDEELERDRDRIVEQLISQVPPPVDRSKQELVSGAPVPEDRSHTELKENGQQRDYVVLSPEERAKGFVRPLRRSYRHEKCGGVTTMRHAIAETYARDPSFYSGTFCCDCGKHFPIATFGQEGEFVWIDDGSKVGS